MNAMMKNSRVVSEVEASMDDMTKWMTPLKEHPGLASKRDLKCWRRGWGVQAGDVHPG
jgi:hypothetical protein